MEATRETIRQLFLEPDFIKSLQELLAPVFEAAVSKALEKQGEKIAALEEDLSTARVQLSTMEEKLTVTQDKLSAIELQMEQLEAENRKTSLIISGVPELPEEDTGSLALDVARAAGVTLSAGDLDRSHRLGKKRGTIDKPRTIVVKFAAYSKRQELFGARKELSGHRVRDHPVLTSQVLENVYISDFLTPKGQNTLFICRQLKKKKLLWAAYSTNGKIRVRTGEHHPPRTVSEASELSAILDIGSRQLSELLNSVRGASPHSNGAGATGGRDASTSGRPPSRAAGAHPSGPTTSNERRQSPRLAGPPQC